MDLRQDKAELEDKINNLLNEFQHKHDVRVQSIYARYQTPGIVDRLARWRDVNTAYVSLDVESKGNTKNWNRR